jgi:hypothetical protein
VLSTEVTIDEDPQLMLGGRIPELVYQQKYFGSLKIVFLIRLVSAVINVSKQLRRSKIVLYHILLGFRLFNYFSLETWLEAFDKFHVNFSDEISH